MRAPGFLTRLDDDRREVLAELVRVHLKPPVFRALECEGERGELLRRAEPDEAALAYVYVGLEDVRMPGADAAIHTVSADDQVRVGEHGLVCHLMLERLVRPELVR